MAASCPKTVNQILDVSCMLTNVSFSTVYFGLKSTVLRIRVGIRLRINA